MATPSVQHDLVQPATSLRATPLPMADEQAAILRAVAHRAPDGDPLELDAPMALAGWEHDLLYREAHVARDVVGAARTLLRARAAEWAIRNLLARADERLPDAYEAASLLLDQVLADIGSATDFPACANRAGLEGIAVGLGELYEQIAAHSLRLAGSVRSQRPRSEPRTWRHAADPFELESTDTMDGAAVDVLLAGLAAVDHEDAPAPLMAPVPPPADVVAVKPR